MHITLMIHKLETSEQLEAVRNQVIEHYEEVAIAVGQGHEFNVQKYNLERLIKAMKQLEESLAHLRQHSAKLIEMGFDGEGKKIQADIQNHWRSVVRGLRTFEAFCSGVTNPDFVLRRLKDEVSKMESDIKEGRIIGHWAKQCIEKMGVHLRRHRNRLIEWEPSTRVDAIMERINQIDSYADIEELTFPLLNPTEEEQQEWFDKFLSVQRDHIEGVLKDEFNE